MLRSLPWKALWPWALTLCVGALIVAAQLSSRRALQQRMATITSMRETLDRALLQIQDRHARTVRRAREALLEPRPENRTAMLAWSAEHYSKEMEHFITAAQQATTRIIVPGADPRLSLDLERLRRQLDRVRQQAQTLAPALESLRDAAARGDADDITAGSQALDRADRAVQAALRIADGMARRASIWQARQAARAPPALPSLVWLAVLFWLPLAAWLSLRPLLRLGRVAGGAMPPRSPLSREEAALGSELHQSQQQVGNLEARLGEREVDVERAMQGMRRAERELALLKLYNENLVNSLSSAIVVTDAAHHLTSFNLAARRLTGLKDADLGCDVGGLPLFHALRQRDANLREDLDRAMAEQQMLRFEAVPFHRPAADGGEVDDAAPEILLDLTLAPYLDESGAARGLLWVSDDVTEAVQTKNQLLATEHLAAIGRISAQVAHEIRNPLSAIGLNTELLEEELGAAMPAEQRQEAADLLSAIGSEIERLTQITEGYLQLARMPRPQVRHADVNQLIADLCTMLAEEMRAHGVDVELDLATPAPRALVDPGQLRQAMLNIVRNSREAMGDGGVLHIRTTGDGDMTHIEFCDTGVGIPPAVVHRVFEPFFSTKPDGTGLGLSLTHQIISEHGGRIEVSRREHGGTRVRLSLPRQPLV